MSSIDDKILFVKVVVGKSPDNAVSWLMTNVKFLLNASACFHLCGNERRVVMFDSVRRRGTFSQAVEIVTRETVL